MEKIMGTVRALVLAVVALWSGTGQAALVYLDAAFASDTVAEDSTGLSVVQTLTANSSGTIWGGRIGNAEIFKITSGNYESFSLPVGIGPVRTKDAGTTYVGGHYNGNPLAPAKVYEASSSGTVSEFVTLPDGIINVARMAVSPVNGDVIVTAEILGGDARLLKYNSSGVLQWNVPSPMNHQPSPAFTPSGNAYVAGADGGIYSLDNATGDITLISAQVSPEILAMGAVTTWDMVFADDNNLFISLTGNNLETIVRTNISTGESDLLAHWDYEIPSTSRWLEYVDGLGLYVNSFDPADLVPSLTQSFGPSLLGQPMSLSKSTASVLLLQGDFAGDFAGFSLVSLVPEPSSAWLLLGLGFFWKRKLANRHSPSGTIEAR
jgi:hypothetical protein